jgi:hypothetical protein
MKVHQIYEPTCVHFMKRGYKSEKKILLKIDKVIYSYT